jgi:predicted dienelactone hydrolase
MLSRFDPVPVSRCNLEQVQYMANVTAAAEDEILGDYGWSRGLLDRFVLEVCKEKYPVESGERKWPLALFSGGLNTTRLFYSHLAQEIASHGFTVITIDHPYDRRCRISKWRRHLWWERGAAREWFRAYVV